MQMPSAGGRVRRLGGLALRVAVVAAVVWVVVRIARRHQEQLRHIHLHLHPGWAVVAAVSTIAASLVLPLAWRTLLAAYGFEMPVASAVRIWCRSQAARYLPTGIAGLGSRVILAGREGVPRSVGAASWLLEFGLLVLGGVVIAGAGLPSSTLATPLRIVAVVGAGGVIVLLPLLIRLGGRVALATKRLAALHPERFRVPTGYAAVALYALNSVAKALGTVLVAAAFFPLHRSDLGLIMGATSAAGVIGLVGITPAGIGVREAALASILQPRFGLGDAAALAVVLRAWDFGVEMVWLGVALALRRPVDPTTYGA